MSTPKPTAPVKAWAVVDQDGTFDIENVFGSEWEADKWCGRLMGEQIVPVLITPLTSEGQK